MLRMFDEINESDRISIEYDSYFGEMDLSDKEKEERKELAKEFEVLFLFLLMAYRKVQSEEIKAVLQNKYRDIAMDFIGTDKETSYIADYSKQIIDEVIRATNENINDPYYTSWDRAMALAEENANSVGNYRQYLEAIKSGKKYKTWETMNDKKVRHTHRMLHNKKIGILEPFKVGDSLMAFPKDAETYGASMEEIAGCRCVAKYS